MSSPRRNSLSPFLLLLLSTAWSGIAEAKRFVVVVGPHETHTSTTTFLSKYAANDGSGAPSFDGWSWPIIESEEIFTSSQHVFDLLVKEPNNQKVQDIIIDGIKSAWNESKHGVFIGSLDFDKVGTNPYSGYDAVGALARVVDELGISAEDVTVIITYRIPRVTQWGLVWKRHFDAESYQDFVCSDDESQKRWEWLDTSMNPFKLAKAYHDQEWDVGVVDQDSILKAGKDVANTIACLAMENENCEDGWVVGLEKSIPKIVSADEIDLSDEDRSDLERLFLFRDCYYVTQLDDSPGFGVFIEDSGFDMILSECKDSMRESYATLSETEFLMNAVQSQKSCEKYVIDIPSVLKEMSAPTIDESIEDDESLDVVSIDGDDGVSDASESGLIDEEIDNDEYETSIDGDDGVSDASESGLIDNDEYETSNSSQSTETFKKKIIVFVGPHETDAVGVSNFFVNYASANEEYEPLESFNGWIWPLIDDEIIKKPANHAFDLLVTDPDNEDIQTTLVGGIVDAWNNSERGVIIGSLNFDSIGENPYSNYDPIDALYRIEEALGINYEDLTVVVNYRSPRIDHWSSIWNNHFTSDNYDDFICSDGDQSDKRWEWLDTVMNPFKIAKECYDRGWNVAVVDQEGAINAGLDTSHTIACQLMDGVNCKNGLVVGLEDVVSDPLTAIPMNLTDDDRRDLEQIFRERDCHFKYELKDMPRFMILNQRTAWSTCSDQHKTYYEQFADTDFMLNLLKSQKKCGENSVDVSDMLENKMVQNDDKKLIVFAGPHETAAIPVTRFFADHASSEEDTENSSSLGGWTWPIIDSEMIGDTESYRIFDLLLSDADTRPIQNIIMDGIRDSWNEAQNGVIIGSLDFDRVGENPETNYDALGAVDRVIQTLGISDNDVTIVLNYRSRRIDHLSAVWWNHFDTGAMQDFICSDSQAEKRWEWMDTVMNPLKLANAYIEEGWNVAVIEQEGTSSAGEDVSHSLACHIMDDVDCDNGWVRGLKSEITQRPNTYEIPDLDSTQRSKLETLFRMRDCFYKSTLEIDDKFTIVNKKELWKSCTLKNNEKYEKLVSTDFFIGVLRSLQGCGDEASPESSAFANELLKSFPGNRNITLYIATLFLVVAVILSFMLQLILKKRKRKKVRKATAYPSEGVFRDHPNNIDSEHSPYHDEIVVDDSMEENRVDGDIGSGETPLEDEVGDEYVEEVDVDMANSNCMIS